MNTLTTPIETWNDAAAAAVEKIMSFPKPAPALVTAEIRLAFTRLEEDFSRNDSSGMLSLQWAGVGNTAYRYADRV